MMEKVEDYSWLEDLINSLPELPKERRNFFDISGFPSWENVNSNFLAFYLQENEEHNFRKLFFNSLLDCISDKLNGDEEGEDRIFKNEDFDSSYSVFREYSTQKGGRIDLLIQSEDDDSDIETNQEELDQKEDWAIIIENKIHHELNNKLDDYWDSVQATKKVGVVLAKLKTPNDQLKLESENSFISITHLELITKLESNLSEYFLEADDRHLLFLKEYFLNIKNLYKKSNPNHIMKEQLIQFQNEATNIEKLLATNTKLLNYVNNESNAAFKKLGCRPSTTTIGTRFKHYYFDSRNEIFIEKKWEKKITDNFRFFVDMNRLRYKKNFWCLFEVIKSNHKKNGEDLIKMLNERYPNSNQFKMVVEGGSNQTHLMSISFDLAQLKELEFSTIVAKGVSANLTFNSPLDVLDTIFEFYKTISH